MLGVQGPDRVDQRRRAARHRHAHRPEVVVDDDVVAIHHKGAGQRVRGLAGTRAVGELEVDDVAPHLALELVGGAFRDDASDVDHADAVGELVGLFQILRGEHDRGALGAQPVDDIPQLQPAARVESRRRLVEEQHGRRDHQAGGEVEAPAHAAGIRAQRAVGRGRQLEHVEQPGGAVVGPVLGHAAEPSDQHQVLPPGEIVVDRGVLTGEPDDAAHELGLADHVVPGDGRVSAVGTEQCREDADRGRLARAVGPEQAHDGGFGRLEVDARERGEVAEALDQALRQDPARRPPADRSVPEHKC